MKVLLFTIAIAIGFNPINIFAAVQAPLQLSSQAAVQADIEDIIGPVLLPTSWPWGTTAIIGMVILLATLLSIYLYRRGRKKSVESAAEIALKKINLLDEPETRRYLEAISNILRQYIETQMGIRSTKQTTKEFLNSIEILQNPETTSLLHDQDLKRYLQIFDQAKFAHQLPQQADMPLIKNAIVAFINETATNSQKEAM
ncbi:DUF4381 family protein [Desulfotalea psychrophila]|uniref:DUF4381 domain-containing protein n=1 Tax=Desulfotalea psychrophila (strain LSv54 / DSM 12343) TaxID=177439 RepID=Q6AQK7_DESPS|nr:DUF4381 family protein [Desulfotalea psychrophila]CAG35366.1 unknown protein [Desulfotalea psychrophila LSv54]